MSLIPSELYGRLPKLVLALGKLESFRMMSAAVVTGTLRVKK